MEMLVSGVDFFEFREGLGVNVKVLAVARASRSLNT